MDMSIYTILTSIINIPPSFSNILSSLVAVTFVYITSTKKLFQNNENKFGVKKKYIFYVIYQIFMILLSSFIIGKLAILLTYIDIAIIKQFANIGAKILFTPVTMIVNFIFMKWLIEKV